MKFTIPLILSIALPNVLAATIGSLSHAAYETIEDLERRKDGGACVCASKFL
jgi:hypothetical protein